MSKLSDYAKFDHIDTDSDTEESPSGHSIPRTAVTTGAKEEFVRDSSNTKRFHLHRGGRVVYSWEQSLSEVVLYVPKPPSASGIECIIGAGHLRLGLKGNPQPYLDQDTGGTIDTRESTWCVEDSSVVIYLQKAHKGILWECALNGSKARLNPADMEDVKKQLMLERYGDEHPGFDFSEANFNGSIPDARTFMGGVKYE